MRRSHIRLELFLHLLVCPQGGNTGKEKEETQQQQSTEDCDINRWQH